LLWWSHVSFSLNVALFCKCTMVFTSWFVVVHHLCFL
jgi:hypothetical protein